MINNRRFRLDGALRFRDARFDDATSIDATSSAARRLDGSDVDLFICIIARMRAWRRRDRDRLSLWSGRIGVICQNNPHLSLHQPHALSSPPLPTIAFQ